MSRTKLALAAAALWLAVLVLLAASRAVAGGAEQTRKVSGKAYDLKSGALVFTTRATETWSNGKVKFSRMDAFDPSHKHIFKHRADYSYGDTTPYYQSDNLLTGARQTAKRRGKYSVVTHRARAGEEEGMEVLPVPGPVVHPEGVGTFIRAHWDKLLAGKSVQFSMVAPSRLSHYRFGVVGAGVSQEGPRQVLTVKMEPSSAILRMFAGELVFKFDTETRALLEYRGMSNVTNREGHAYTVRLLLESDPERVPSGAPEAAAAR